MDPSHQKTLPKDQNKIRAALESLRQGADRTVETGPFHEGLPADTRVVIASFHQAEGGRRYQERLLQAGIMSSGRFHRTGAEISVDKSDCDRAAELLQRHLQEYPDRASESWRRDFDYTILGSLVTATFGLIVLYGEIEGLRDAVVLLAFTLLGAVSGYCCDQPRNRYRRTGSWQFGLGDVLGLMAIIAVAFLIWRLLAGR
jgi:hypothetical protein